ncbi:hypothetical protein [Aquimarina sp. RZ0]|uniref:hypothetical protein n=1 Tax=Aquimarina sp. RZ0 TaxID=2607730 RepID=UPI0011F3C08C|nr:hypothetical protein [Aquimarina sp. RZ0]KAA1246312.1 hypothetical protein F0000_08440 [Aquimarina sp. RZ0]
MERFKIPKKELQFINGSQGANNCVGACIQGCNASDSRGDTVGGEDIDDCKKTCVELCDLA